MQMQFQEGQRRRSRTTGEVQEFRNGAWVPVGGGQPAPAAPPTGQPSSVPGMRFMPGPERQPPPQTSAQAEGDVVDLQRDRAALEQAPVDLERAQIERDRAAVQLQQDQREAQTAEHRAAQSQQQRDAAMAQIQQTIQNAREAQRLSREGWFTTGFGAGAARRVAPGGSPQADLQALLSQIGSNTAFDRLQRMRDMSPTGGALGQVSNIELELLKNSIASLDVTQSDEQFQRNMQSIIDAYGRVYQGLGGDPATLGGGTAAEPSRRAPPGTELRFNDEIPDAPVNPLSAEQQRAWDAFTAANPRANEQQIDSFFQSIGIDPAQANVQDLARAFQEGAEPRPASESRYNMDISDVRGQGGLGETLDATIRGVADIPTFGYADEISAAGDTLFGGGTMQENLARQRAIDEYDTENNFAARMGGQLAGGVLLPSRAAAAGRGAARSAMRAGEGRIGASLAARQASRRQLTGEGAAFGAGYGTGASEGGVGDRLAGGATSALVGGGTANALARVGGAITSRSQRNALLRRQGDVAIDGADLALDRGLDVASPGQRVATAQRFGVDMPLGSARGRGSAIVDNALSNMPASATVMNESRRRLAGQVESAVEDVAGGYGDAATMYAGGQAAQRGVRNWISRFERVAGQAYEAIPIPPRVLSTLDNTRGALRSLTDIFRSNPTMEEAFRNGRLHTYLRALTEPADEATDAIATNDPLGGVLRTIARQAEQPAGQLSWEDLKHFRSIIGEQIGEVRFSDSPMKSQLRALYGALSEDMRATAAAQGSRALRSFERANNLYREGQRRIEGALVSILGDDAARNPEAAARAIQTIARSGRGSSNLDQLRQIRSSMRKGGEWNEVAGALIRLSGRPANSEGREFSAQTFIRNYDDMTDEARNLLFGGRNNPLRKSLDEYTSVVRRLAERDALRNTSNTAGQVVTGAAFFSLGNVPALVGQAVGSYGVAKLWTNPRFVRWATNYERAASRDNRSAVQRHAKALASLARSEPTIASEVSGLQQFMLEQLGAQNDR